MTSLQFQEFQSANPGRAVLCAVCTALALAGMSPAVLSQSPGAASLQGVGQLAGTVGSKRASLIAKIAPQLKAGLSAQEAAAVLGSADELKEGYRANAIQSIARAKKLGPLGAETGLMLKGTSGSSRAFSIAEIAPYLKAGLTAQEAADILGTSADLGEGYRANAIQVIARAKKLAALGADTALMLKGTTGSSRAFSIAEVAPYLKAGLTAQDAADILGTSADLGEGYRANAIQSIARANKLGALGAEAALMLEGTSGSSRAARIAEIPPYLNPALTAQDAAAILGSADELKEGYRANAIQSIARAMKLGPLRAETALMLKGTSGSSRAFATSEIAPYLKAGLTAQETAAILGTPNELNEGYRANAIQSIARAKKLGSLGAEAALMLEGTSGSSRAASIAEITPYLKTELTAQDAAAILGSADELKEGYRANAIQSIARAGKVRAGLSEAELAPVLHGTTGSARAFALAELRAAKPIGAVGDQAHAVGSRPSPSEVAGVQTSEGSTPASTVSQESDISSTVAATPCTAPNVAAHLYIAKADCRQLWSYHLYRLFAIATFSAQQDLISLAEKRALQVQFFVDKVNSIAGVFHSVATTKEVQVRIFKAVWESSGLALNLVPLDEAGGAQYARDFIGWMRDSLEAWAEHAMTGGVAPPYSAVVGLANRFGALWNIQFKVLAERNAINLAREYLTSYYRYGGDGGKVAVAYGLGPSASLEDVLGAIARQSGMSRLDYSLGKASRWVSSFKVAINGATEVCLQDSLCRGQ